MNYGRPTLQHQKSMQGNHSDSNHHLAGLHHLEELLPRQRLTVEVGGYSAERVTKFVSCGVTPIFCSFLIDG